MNRLPFSFGGIRGAVKWLLIANTVIFVLQQFMPQG